MDCEVIIPVGPGHESLLDEAAQSVVMAFHFSKGPFDTISVRAEDDLEGKLGRSAARNLAVSKSTADWVYFLDADDRVLPEVFESAFPYVDEYDAIWSKFGELHDNLIFERYQAYGFSDYQVLLEVSPQYTVKMGHFIRREIALKYPFNVEMNCGEDWEYYLRVWKNQKCVKSDGPVCYVKTRGQHSTGPRSATGKEWGEAVMKLIKEARG